MTYQRLDILKFTLSLFVVLFHATLGVYSQLEFIFFNGFFRVAVPLFFMMSGFMFYKMSDAKRRKYTKSLMGTYMLYFVMYVPVGLAMHQGTEASYLSGSGFINFFNLIINGTGYHLWFLPALLFSLIILNKSLKRSNLSKLIVVSFFLFLIGNIESNYDLIISNFPFLKKGINLYFSVFITTRNGLFLGLFFTSIGAMIAKYEKDFATLEVTPLMPVSIILVGMESWYKYNGQMGLDYNFLISSIPLSLSIFTHAISKHDKILTNSQSLLIRKMSSAIYYDHLFVLFFCSQVIQFENKYITAAILVMITILMSYLKYQINRKGEYNEKNVNCRRRKENQPGLKRLLCEGGL